MLDNYLSFDKSHIYSNMYAECFGWGLWHDPSTKQKGCTKNNQYAKEGYSHFLKLAGESNKYSFGKQKNPKTGLLEERKRYGYTGPAAVEFALKRIKEL